MLRRAGGGPRMRTLPAASHVWNGGPDVEIGENGGPERASEDENENDG